MAWIKPDINLPLSDFNNDSYVCENSSGYRNSGTGSLNSNITPNRIEKNYWTDLGDRFLLGDETCGIKYVMSYASGSSAYRNNGNILFYLNNEVVAQLYLRLDWGQGTYAYQRLLVIGVNDETEKATCWVISKYYGFNPQSSSYSDVYCDYNASLNAIYNSSIIYQVIKGLMAPTYNWQSVPSVSGKLGTFNLSKIKEESINGGEAVSGASASAFDNLENSTKLSTLLGVN